MALTGRERRELREIERALIAADPAFAALFVQSSLFARDRPAAADAAGFGPGAVHRARVAAGAFVAVSVLLIVAGLVLRDSGLLVGGCLVLLMMPPTVCLIAAADRHSR